MRRSLTVPASSRGVQRKLALVLSLFMLVPAAALAGFPGGAISDYEGTIQGDQTTAFGFDTERRNGHRGVGEFDVAGIPFSCRDGSTQRESVLFSDSFLRVHHKHFEGSFDDGMVGIVLHVDGRLRSNGRARGVMRLTTRSNVPQGQCYSGLMRWKASR